MSGADRGATGLFVLANATGLPVEQWLETADFEYGGGRGRFTFTTDPFKARVFNGVLDAVSFWKTVSETEPQRADGQPNRPLTAYTVSPRKLPIFDSPHDPDE